MSTKDLAYYLNLRYTMEIKEGASGGYFATHPELDGCMAEGATLDEVVSNLADSRELWIEARLSSGYPVPEPVAEEYSGKVSLRMPPSRHEHLVRLAARDGISLNLLINSVLASYTGGVEPLTGFIVDARSALADLRAVAGEFRSYPTSAVSPGPSAANTAGPAVSDQNSRVLPFNRMAGAST